MRQTETCVSWSSGHSFSVFVLGSFTPGLDSIDLNGNESSLKWSWRNVSTTTGAVSLYKARITGRKKSFQSFSKHAVKCFCPSVFQAWASVMSVRCSCSPSACSRFTHQPTPGTNKQPDPVTIQSVEHRVCCRESGDQRSEGTRRTHWTAATTTRSYRQTRAAFLPKIW